MASTQTPELRPHHPLSTNREPRAVRWARENTRVLSFAGAALVAATVLGIGWRSTQRAKSQRGEGALLTAQAALVQGDPAGAERGLRDVANRYAGTPAGAQAQLLLAQALYDQGRYQDGLNALTRAKPPAQFDEAVRLLTAAGYEGLGRAREAAAIYEQVASRGDVVPRRRDELRAAAARAYQLAGDRAAALRLWRQVAQDGTGPIIDEARVRVGELGQG